MKKIYKPFVPLTPILFKNFLKVEEDIGDITSLLQVNNEEFLAISTSETTKHIRRVLSNPERNILYLFGAYAKRPLELELYYLSPNLLHRYKLPISLSELPCWTDLIDDRFRDKYLIVINKCNHVYKVHFDVILGYIEKCLESEKFLNTEMQKVTVKNGIITKVENNKYLNNLDDITIRIQNLKNKIIKFKSENYDILQIKSVKT